MTKSPIVVAGGGLVGLSVAYGLAKRGAKEVFLFERHCIGAHNSTRISTGMINNPCFYTDRSLQSVVRKSHELYAELDSRGTLGFTRCGRVYLASSDDTAIQARRMFSRLSADPANSAAELVDCPSEMLSRWPMVATEDVKIQNRPHPYASSLARFNPIRLMNGHLVCSLYLFTKVCYSVNIMLQFALLNAALTSKDHFLFGFQVLSDLYEGKSWTKSGHFPRVTLCDFEVRYLANLNRYTVQCALIINIINEKVFAFFWLWYCLLLCATTCSALFWLSNILLHIARVDYVLKFMQIAEHSEQQRSSGRTPKLSQQKWAMAEEGEMPQFIKRPFRVPSAHSVDKFVDEFLKSDGLFILRLVATNAGELVVVDIVKCLWREFSSRQFHIRPLVYENELSEERRREDEDSHHSLLLNVYSSRGNGPTHQQQQRKQSQQLRYSTNGNSLGLPLPTMSRPPSVVALEDSVGTPSPV